ncbi:MAG: helix-turn-helix transcriptional regulator [Clostridiales bacterium]|jgi:transcriptional regulator with XRE-family HTH domain|nr:helix-turn-helix transcriptional regulator [Clostridiales bacterium]
MAHTLGSKIAELRKNNGMTQDELSEKLGVTPQAVSKWENDISCPDIMLLPKIANLLGTTCDELLSNEPRKETVLLPEERRKNPDDMVLRINVNSSHGDKVRVNLPIPLIKVAIEMGMNLDVSGNDVLKNIDMEQIMALVERGLIGKLVEVESSDGDTVEIVVD